MNQYELVVMFPTSVNDVAAEKKVADKCEKFKITIVGLEKWGVKPLAYPIKKQEKAYYLKYNLEAEGERLIGMEKALKIDESVMRYLLIRVEDNAKINNKVIKKGNRKEKNERQKSK